MAYTSHEFTVTGPTTIASGYRDAQGQFVPYLNFDRTKQIRRIYQTVTDLSQLPEQAFKIKVSQSKKAEFAGKLAFSYLSFRIGDQPVSSMVPDALNLNIAMPLADIKAVVVGATKEIAESGNATLVMNIKSPFQSIQMGDGNLITVYDNNEFPSEDPSKLGNPNYYLPSNTDLTVHYKSAEKSGNEYYQISLSTDIVDPGQLFKVPQRAKVWDGGGDVVASGDMDTTGWGEEA